ncbi:hypothetical protein ACGFMM_34395 [Streptomyces sp. NPDC048604]|uniref:hypothetical protein n=1 Tax=Streptomyces sp. NPDC048604 TaxID=3365578 RepID=UPI003722D992
MTLPCGERRGTRDSERVDEYTDPARFDAFGWHELTWLLLHVTQAGRDDLAERQQADLEHYADVP